MLCVMYERLQVDDTIQQGYSFKTKKNIAFAAFSHNVHIAEQCWTYPQTAGIWLSLLRGAYHFCRF